MLPDKTWPELFTEGISSVVNIRLMFVPLNSVCDLSLKNVGPVLSTSEILF